MSDEPEAAENTPDYGYNKTWRERHPERRHKWKTSYRARTGSGTGPRLGKPWTTEEDRAALAHAVPDRELAKQIGRSVQAIAVRRNRLKELHRVTSERNTNDRNDRGAGADPGA